MSQLPECDYRGDASQKWFECRHPDSRTKKVCPDICRLCKLSKEPGKYIDQVGKDDGPGLVRLAVNFALATAKHVANGFEKVTEAIYKQRLAQCDTCEFRNGNRCKHMACGCYLPEKAMWASEKCPLGKWDGV